MWVLFQVGKNAVSREKKGFLSVQPGANYVKFTDSSEERSSFLEGERKKLVNGTVSTLQLLIQLKFIIIHPKDSTYQTVIYTCPFFLIEMFLPSNKLPQT